ncbi:MAG: ABC transporter permease subunit [Isosphaeraceae bacterium]|nr:ABC transporter permease subunit [Isosphaeraceae bacterium]
MRSRATDAFAAAFLAVVLVFPAIATILEAAGGGAVESTPDRGGALIVSTNDDSSVRPLRVALRTLELVGSTSAIVLPVGLVAAALLFRTDLFGRGLLASALVVIALIPMPLHAAAWLGGFGNLGRSQALGSAPVLVGMGGAAVVHAIAALPWVVLIIGLGLREVEPELEEAALLEGNAWSVFRRVTLRRSLGMFAAAALATAVMTAGDMTVTDLLGIRTYAEEAYLQYQIGQGPAAAAATAIPPLIVVGSLLFVVTERLAALDPERIQWHARIGRTWRLGRGRVWISLLAWCVVALLAGLPLYSLIWRAGRVNGDAAAGLLPYWSLEGLFGSLGEGARAIWPSTSRWMRKPLWASLVLAACSTTVATAGAWCLAWSSRGRRWVRRASMAAAAAALAAPGPVAGMAFVLAYRHFDWIYDSPWIVVLAAAGRVWPYAFLLLLPSLLKIPSELLEARRLEGLSAGAVLRRTVPRLSAGPAAGAWAVGFLLAFGELPAVNLVAPPGLTTLPILVWGALHIGVESRLAAIALWLTAIYLVAGAATSFALRLGRRSFDPSERARNAD